MILVRCVLCGARCVPMADYDAPVCHECDDRHEAALARLDTMPPPARHIPWVDSLAWGAGAVAHAKQLVRADAPPARPEDLAALMEAFSGEADARRARTNRARRAAA